MLTNECNQHEVHEMDEAEKIIIKNEPLKY